MINILFFAKYREILGENSIQFASTEPLPIFDIIEQLSAKGAQWTQVFSQDNLMIAVNQQMSNMDTIVKSGDEVAFFPPVTGG